MRKVTIKRPSRLQGSAIRWGIWLDERFVGKISKGKTITLEMDEQEHHIAMKGAMITSTLFDEITIPSGSTMYYFQIDLIGVKSEVEVAPVFRPCLDTEAALAQHAATALRAGCMVAKQLLNTELIKELNNSQTAYLQLNFDKEQWSIHINDKGQERSIYQQAYWRFSTWKAKFSPVHAYPIDHNTDKATIKKKVLNDFVAYLPDYRVNDQGNVIPASRPEIKPITKQEPAQPNLSIDHKIAAILFQPPKLEDIRKDPSLFDKEAEALLHRLFPLAGCKTELDKPDPTKPAQVILHSNLRSTMLMTPPKELLPMFEKLSFDEQCLLCKILWLSYTSNKVEGIDPVKKFLQYTITKLPTEDLLRRTEPRLLRRFITEAMEKIKDDKTYQTQLRNALAKSVLACSKLYIAYDQLSPKSSYPFIELNGRILLFTDRELANKSVAFYEQKRLGKLIIKQLQPDKYTDFFDTLNEIAAFVCVDQGDGPVEMPLKLLTNSNFPDLVNLVNCTVRGLRLRELEISARMKAFPMEQGTPEYINIANWMLTARLNGYSRMGQSLFYVYAPRNDRSDDLTYVTPAAQEHAAKLALQFPDSSLQAHETKAVALYEDQLTLRVINKPGEMEVKKGLVCAFTSRKAAMECLADFRAQMCDDIPVVITFDELLSQAQQCAGIMLDLKGLSTVYVCSQFDEMKKYAALNSPVVVNLKQNDT